MQILCLFFFFFYSRAAVSVVFFHLAVLFRFYRVLFLHHVFLSEQIKMMMNLWQSLVGPRQCASARVHRCRPERGKRCKHRLAFFSINKCIGNRKPPIVKA